MCTNFKSTPQGHVKSPTFWNFLDFVKNLTHQDFFSKFHVRKIVAGGINGLSINKDLDKKKILICQIFDEVRKISKFGWFDMPLGSTFEIGTQIILSKIDGFLKGWILNITPLKVWGFWNLPYVVRTMYYASRTFLVNVLPFAFNSL